MTTDPLVGQGSVTAYPVGRTVSATTVISVRARGRSIDNAMRATLAGIIMIASRSAHAQPPRNDLLAITNASVVDVRSGQLLRDRTVLIAGHRITAIGPSATVRPSRQARVISGRGKYLIPGLIDTHVHLFTPWANNWPDTLAQFGWILASGVTTIRDAGGQQDNYVRLRAARDSGLITAPRLIVTSFWSATKVRSVGAAATAAEYRDRGYDQVKLRGLAEEQALVAIRTARAAGLRVWGHTARPGDTTDTYTMAAVRAGISGVTHALRAPDGRVPEPSGPPVSYRSTPAEWVESDLFALGRELGRGDDWQRPLIDSMVAHGVWYEPTLSVSLHDWNALYGHCAREYDQAAIRRYYPGFVGPRVRVPHSAGRQDTVRRICERRFRFVREYYEAGGMLVTGSDYPPIAPLGVPEEMRLLVRAGIPAGAALRAATLNGAIALGLEGDVGTIEVGKYADLVLLDANPLQDVMNVRKIAAIIADGRLLDHRAMWRRVGTTPPMLAYDDLPEKFSQPLRALLAQRQDTLLNVVFTLTPGTSAANRKGLGLVAGDQIVERRVDGDRVFARASSLALRISSRIRFVKRIDLDPQE